MRVLVVNAGSSSIKLRVVDSEERVVWSDDLPASGGRFDAASLEAAVRRAPGVDAVGHRVVHGGTRFGSSVLVDAGVVEALRGFSDLAPLHQPHSLAALDVVSRALPGVPAIACLDTAFHSSLPAAAATYAIPQEWRMHHGVRRYGFHGLSHAYAARRSCELLGRPLSETKVVTCHLGAGASLAAVHNGSSVDTTMGFTPLEGLVMATRSGSVDPGVVLWLQRSAGLSADEVAENLEYRSGLYGLAGTADMAEILRATSFGDASASLAVDVYVHRLRAGIASMTAAMNGLDALVFTGGVGENSSAIRERAARGLRFLGIEVDPASNSSPTGDADVSEAGAAVRTLVVRSREDLQIAREVRELLDG